jgi:hypothetical protein
LIKEHPVGFVIETGDVATIDGDVTCCFYLEDRLSNIDNSFVCIRLERYSCVTHVKVEVVNDFENRKQ